MGCAVRGLGFGVWGLGFGVWDLGFGLWSLGFGVEFVRRRAGLEDTRFRVPGPRFCDWGFGFRVPGSGFRVSGFGFRVPGSYHEFQGSRSYHKVEEGIDLAPRFRVSSSGFRISSAGSHLQTLIIYKLGFNQNHYTFTLILPIKIGSV